MDSTIIPLLIVCRRGHLITLQFPLMNPMVAFGMRMRHEEQRGYSQERLAELAAFTALTWRSRAGERNVSLVNIWRIADALEISPSALFAVSDNVTASMGMPSSKRDGEKDVKWTRGRRH